MSNRRPFMPLYIADYLKDTTHLGALESGAYLHLIMDYWQNGKLPDDDRHLARIAKLTDKEWKKLKPTLQAFFHDGWKHKRIDQEIGESIRIGESNAGKAREAANKRWFEHKKKKQEAMPEECLEHNTSNAPECTLHTSHFTEEKNLAADAAPVGKAYAFEDGIIRLNQRDFDAWRKAYSHLDLAAELLSLSKWAESEGKNWFHAVKGALAKRNREVKAEKDRQAAQGGFKWNGIEGVI